MANEQAKKGNPNWSKGTSGNPEGRPRVLDKDKKTNRTQRQEEFMSLVRKFKPHIAKAVKAAVAILENDKASESGKLRASALILQTYQDLVKSLYDYRYDEEEAEEIQESNKKPAFSLHMIPTKDSEE